MAGEFINGSQYWNILQPAAPQGQLPGARLLSSNGQKCSNQGNLQVLLEETTMNKEAEMPTVATPRYEW